MSAPRRRPGPGGPGGPMMGEKAKDFKGTVGKLLTYMGVYKIALLFVAIFSIVSTILSIQGPKILGGATDELFNGLMAVPNLLALLALAGVVVAIDRK